jgi:hypothetical protein
MSGDLRKETIEKIEDFLAGRIPRTEVVGWAVKILTKRAFGTDELVLEDAITALSGLHDEDERFDTAREDLLYFRNCLLKETSYLVSIEFPARQVAEEAIEYESSEEDVETSNRAAV